MFPPFLPPTPSWYPGHMSRFTRLLPAYLTRTDIVLELRDARLPLTSVNPAFERIITKWQMGRKKMGAGAAGSDVLGERIIVLGKKDLVGQWGLEPFRKAMLKNFPEQHVHFTSHTKSPSIKELSQLLISLAQRRNDNGGDTAEINVLVVGMPNVGKSTLLNALRNEGIAGRTPKALKTSAHPGLTRALSTRLKLSLDPLIYSFDTPGVMVPFLGRGDRGAERGVKLALIAGIKEGLYDVEALAAYLVYRLWVLNPHHPAYMTLLSPTTPPHSSPPSDATEFIQSLASRLGMIRRGGELDLRRAAVWFIKWWREEGGLVDINLSSPPLPPLPPMLSPPLLSSQSLAHASARVGGDGDFNSCVDGSFNSVADTHPTPRRMGWGFDFEWECEGEGEGNNLEEAVVQEKMENIIAEYFAKTKEEENSLENVSSTQEKKKIREEKIARRKLAKLSSSSKYRTRKN